MKTRNISMAVGILLAALLAVDAHGSVQSGGLDRQQAAELRLPGQDGAGGDLKGDDAPGVGTVSDQRDALNVASHDISVALDTGEGDVAAYEVIAAMALESRSAFYLYRDADSGFNHGFASGVFGTGVIELNAGCIDDAASPYGCALEADALDCARGTVLAIRFYLVPGTFAGLNFEEPQNWGQSHTGRGYDLTGATHVRFDARSPDGIGVKFELGGQSTGFVALSDQWTELSLAVDPDLTDANVLFTVVTDHAHAGSGRVVLLDNLRLEPVPESQPARPGLPLSTQTCGVVPLESPSGGRVAYPPDQVNRNMAALYEAALALQALLRRGTPADLQAAAAAADALVYALGHDNSGARLPVAPDGSRGLHNAYMSGDLALYSDQPSPAQDKAGEIRLSGFSSQDCSPSGFCLMLDGATGGNNAFVILALAEAYRILGKPEYRDSALEIGRWIHENLKDASGTGYGGYFLGYPDEGIWPKELQKGKSVENNADIFSAFMSLAALERARGDYWRGAEWMARAYHAGDFVMRMFDEARDSFHAGTVPAGTGPGPGVEPAGARLGDDVVNTFEFLDANTFAVLALAPFPRYRHWIDWRRVVQYTLDNFARAVTSQGQTYRGFNLVRSPAAGPDGIAWEFTAQVVEAMRVVDGLYGEQRFAGPVDEYLNALHLAQVSPPFADGRGMVAATIEAVETIPPYEQCLTTPFQCIPQRVGLAATAWYVMAENRFNPFLPGFTIRGDLNGDGCVTLADAVIALRIVAGHAPAGSLPEDTASGSDVNLDHRIGLEEALYILAVAAELRPPL